MLTVTGRQLMPPKGRHRHVGGAESRRAWTSSRSLLALSGAGWPPQSGVRGRCPVSLDLLGVSFELLCFVARRAARM